MTNWMLDIIIKHRRLRGLNELQLRELIESAGDIESLRIIKDHLEGGSFRYAHIQMVASEMMERCKERAVDIQWQQHAPAIKDAFLRKLADPFAETKIN